MIENCEVLAIIPARGGSKGLAGKNRLELCGKPLVAWPVDAARGTRYVDRVVVSTDDEQIAAVATRHRAEVPFLRPAELASDTASSFSVLAHALETLQRVENYRPDYVVMLEPTSPLTTSADVDRALEQLHRSRSIADAIVGVCWLESTHPDFLASLTAEGTLLPYGRQDFSHLGRRQELRPVYFFEGTLYISGADALLARQTFYHERTLGYVVPKWKSLEIDDLVDFVCVEAVMNNLSRFEKPGV